MRLLPAIFLGCTLGLGMAVAADEPAAKAPEPTPKAGEPTPKTVEPAKSGKAVVYVIPVREEIGDPILYIMRRGLKEAIERKADAVVLDMETPGGRADVMLEIMEALDKFQGERITYVNSEAGSAGAIIAAVTDEIYFAPKGVMGAAEVVTGDGEDLSSAMKRKIDSYLSAKIETYTRKDPRRADVIKAMRIADFELKLDDKVIKSKGELLTLTAERAIALYGDPPTPLLATGIAKDLDSLLAAKFPDRGFEKIELQVTWSEKLAQWLAVVSPILMGLGLLALFVEFKTPGFGWMGATGIILMLLVFFGHYSAGLSGHEPALLFGIGVLLVAVELLFFPGTAVAAVTGVAFMLVSLIWAGADLWPNEPFAVSFSGDVLMRPVLHLVVALAIAVASFAAVAKYLPQTSLYRNLVVSSAPEGPAQMAGVAPERSMSLRELIGLEGVATTGLFPSGEIEIAGRRYQAMLELGSAPVNTRVRVVGYSDFGLKVERSGET